MALPRRPDESRGVPGAPSENLACIAFDGCQVAVASGAPEVIAGVRRVFREMLAQEPGLVVSRLEVQAAGDEYRLLGSEGALLASGPILTVLHTLKHQVALELIAARPDLIWFHAAAAAQAERAVVILGSWGHGKSSLAAGLCGQGWTYLTDDVLPFDPRSGRVLPFPEMPMVREDPGREIPRQSVGQLSKLEVAVEPAAVGRQPVRLSALIFPTYHPGMAAQIEPCSPASVALGLVQHCLNFTGHPGTMRYFCDVLAYRPAYRLLYGDRGAAVERIAATGREWTAEIEDAR